MKKMMIRFFSGCALIGVGLGIMALELKDWKIVDFNPAVTDEPVKTYTKVIDFDTTTLKEVEINYNQQYKDGSIKVVTDKEYTDKLKITVDYKGVTPDVYLSANGGNNRSYYHFWIPTYNRGDEKYDYYGIIKSMFDNKTYYNYDSNTYIESVTLHTAHPENIELSGMGIVIDTSNG